MAADRRPVVPVDSSCQSPPVTAPLSPLTPAINHPPPVTAHFINHFLFIDPVTARFTSHFLFSGAITAVRSVTTASHNPFHQSVTSHLLTRSITAHFTNQSPPPFIDTITAVRSSIDHPQSLPISPLTTPDHSQLIGPIAAP